jgi:hypothetical protein
MHGKKSKSKTDNSVTFAFAQACSVEAVIAEAVAANDFFCTELILKKPNNNPHRNQCDHDYSQRFLLHSDHHKKTIST